MNIAIACERGRSVDEKHIRNKAKDYTDNAEKYIWEIREYKIEEFKRKLKKQLPELRKKAMMKIREKEEKKAQEEAERKAEENERIRLSEEAQKLLAIKKIVINDIISIKEQRVVRIIDKKI